jgi:hypothetical protein
VDLHPVAVELDLMDPDGTRSIDDASAGSMKPGYVAFTPIAAGFLRGAISIPPPIEQLLQTHCREPEQITVSFDVSPCE